MIIFFCWLGNDSNGASIPRSPLAIIIASETFIILSKFLSLVSDSRKNPLVTEFRSIERVTETKIGLGEAFNKTFYESVKIRNHPKLETVNINSYILPGQFKIFQPEPEEVEEEIVKDEDIDNKAVKVVRVGGLSDTTNLHSNGDYGLQIIQKDSNNNYSNIMYW